MSGTSSKGAPPPDGTKRLGRDRSLSIGARWAIRYTAATVVLLILLTGVLYKRIAATLLNGAELELQQQARSINEIIGRHPDDPALIAAFLESEITGSNPDLQLAVAIYDTARQRTLGLDLLAPFADPPPVWQPAELGDMLLYWEQRDAPYPYLVLLAQNVGGFTRVAIYAGSYLIELEKIRGVLLRVLAIGTVLTGVVGWWLARQSLRPISRITDTARQVSAMGSSDWIPTRGTGDELDVLANTLNDMLRRIRDSTDRMRRFAAQAAHELRSPLAVARMRIEIAMRQEMGEAAYRSALEGVLTDLDVLGEGVNAVLDIARSALGLEPDELEPVEVAELLSSVAEFFRPLAEDRGIRMGVPPKFQSIVLGDRLWLHRLFSSLVDNAIKYSKEGDSIDYRVVEKDGQVWIEVCDTGIGIGDEDAAQIFERFYRGNADATGLGLGLTLAMEIARAHGGTVEYETRDSPGSVFRVCLPVSGAARVA